MDMLLKSDARKTKENVFFFSEGLHMLTCALDGYKKNANAIVAIRVSFSFLTFLL